MLSRVDHALVQRERALPGLATVLDPYRFVDALHAALSNHPIEAAQPTYIRYRPKHSCLVAYTIDMAGRPTNVYAKACAEPFFREKRGHIGISGLSTPERMMLDDRAIIVSFFPHDDQLPALRHLAERETRQEIARAVFPRRPDLWDCRLEVLRYKPERRLVARLRSGQEQQVALHLYTKRDYQSALIGARAFQSRGSLAVPALLGKSKEYRILACEWLAGNQLHERLLNPTTDAETLRRVGAALAELHAQPADSLLLATRGGDVAAPGTICGLGALHPPLGTWARKLSSAVMEALEAKQYTTPCPIHGNFSADRVLIDNDTVGIIDFDWAALGDPAADLGRFTAYLEHAALYGDISQERASMLGWALFEGYRYVRDTVPLARVHIYTAASLLQLAIEPFRRREHEWLERAEAIMERAEAVLYKTVVCS